MKKRRLLALLIALTMLIVPLAVTSCKKDTGEGGGEEIKQDEDKMLSPAFGNEHLTFDNEDYIVMTKGDRSKGQAWNTIDLVIDDNLGDVTIIDAVQRRNDLIEQNFKVKIQRVSSSTSAGDFKNEILSAIEKQDDTYDAFMPSVETGLTIALNGTLMNLSDADYIDLSNPWWDQGVIENLMLFGGAYIALGDVNTVDNDGTWCVLFNKEILDAYGTPSASMYDLVKSGIGVTGGWTVEELTRIAQKSYKQDPNSTEKWRPDYTGSGTYGLFTQTEVATVMVQSSGNTPTIKSDGMAGIVSNIKTPEFQDAIDRTFAFMGNRMAADWYLNLDNVDDGSGDKWQTVARGGFMANKAAFYITHIGTIDLIRDMKADFGIIPVPKLTENQEDYGNTIQYGNATCYIIPYRMDDYLNEKACYILEALCYYSSTEFDETGCLSYAYYTLCLQAKGTRDDDAWDMLDIIFDNRVFDLACALNIKDINNIIRNCTTYADNNWVSQRDAQLGSLDSEIGTKLEILAKG